MDLNRIMALVARLTDDQLMQEINQPSGVAPLQILAAEAQRRATMRGGKPKGYAEGGSVNPMESWRRIAASAQNPMSFINPMLTDAGLMKAYGVDQPKLTEDQLYEKATARLPDRFSGAMGEAMAQLQKDYDDTKRSGKGRALMEMGLAMMQSKDPSFLGALGAGGQAGLAVRDRIKQQERGLMQAVMQGKIAQAQTQAQRDATLLNTATQMGASQDQKFGNFTNAAVNIGGQGQRTAMDIAGMGQRSEEAQLGRDHAMMIARMQEAGANSRAAMAARNAGGGMKFIKPEDAMKAVIEERNRIYEYWYDDKGRPKPGVKPKDSTQRRPTIQEIEEQARGSAAQRMLDAGFMPPETLFRAWTQMYGDARSGAPSVEVAKPATLTNKNMPAANRSLPAAPAASLNQRDIDALALKAAGLKPVGG